MKVLMAFLILLTSLVLVAADSDEQFAALKKKHMQRMEEQLAMFQKTKDCMDKATDSKLFKKCQDELKSQSKQLHEKYQKEHAQELDQRIKKLQEEKQKLEKEKKS